MIKKTLSLNSSHFYLPLASLLIVILLFYKFNPKVSMQLVTIGALIYVVSALIHHHFDKTLTLEVIIEYVLLASLIIIIILSQFL